MLQIIDEKNNRRFVILYCSIDNTKIKFMDNSVFFCKYCYFTCSNQLHNLCLEFKTFFFSEKCYFSKLCPIEVCAISMLIETFVSVLVLRKINVKCKYNKLLVYINFNTMRLNIITKFYNEHNYQISVLVLSIAHHEFQKLDKMCS